MSEATTRAYNGLGPNKPEQTFGPLGVLFGSTAISNHVSEIFMFVPPSPLSPNLKPAIVSYGSSA